MRKKYRLIQDSFKIHINRSLSYFDCIKHDMSLTIVCVVEVSLIDGNVFVWLVISR